MAMHRFRFLADILSPTEGRITGDELHHLKKVVRLGVADEVEVFTGKGESGTGVIESISSTEARVSLTTHLISKPSPKILHFGMGALKPQSMDELLPSLVELGVGRFHVIWQKDTPKFRVDDKVAERWGRILLGACKQSKRDFLPEIQVWTDLEKFLEWATANTDRRFLLDLAQEKASLQGLSSAENVLLLGGGERGFSNEEKMQILRSNFQELPLSEHVLRAYTAAISGCAVLGFAMLSRPS